MLIEKMRDLVLANWLIKRILLRGLEFNSLRSITNLMLYQM